MALEALSLGIHPGFRFAASLLLLVAGLITPLQAWYGWKRTEAALREQTPLPSRTAYRVPRDRRRRRRVPRAARRPAAMNQPFDAGLQPEHAAMAWRRTSLALLTGSFLTARILTARILTARILPELFGPWSALAGLAGVVCAGALLASVHRRYRRDHHGLNGEGDRYPLASGCLVGTLATFAFAVAIVSVSAVVVMITAP